MQRQDMGKEREGERELTLREPLDTTRSEARSTLQVFRYISQKVFFFFFYRGYLGVSYFCSVQLRVMILCKPILMWPAI